MAKEGCDLGWPAPADRDFKMSRYCLCTRLPLPPGILSPTLQWADDDQVYCPLLGVCHTFIYRVTHLLMVLDWEDVEFNYLFHRLVKLTISEKVVLGRSSSTEVTFTSIML